MAMAAPTPSDALATVAPADLTAAPPPPALPPRRPLLAPPPPVRVKPLALPTWWATARSAPTPLVRPPAPPAPAAPAFASLGLAPCPPDLSLALGAAAAWGLLAAARRWWAVVGGGKSSEDAPAAGPLPDLACRVAGALGVGGASSSASRPDASGEEEEEEGGPPAALAALDPATLAAYRRFTRGARLGRVREWAPLEG